MYIQRLKVLKEVLTYISEWQQNHCHNYFIFHKSSVHECVVLCYADVPCSRTKLQQLVCDKHRATMMNSGEEEYTSVAMDTDQLPLSGLCVEEAYLSGMCVLTVKCLFVYLYVQCMLCMYVLICLLLFAISVVIIRK